MTLTIAQFREQFPEFASSSTYPDAVVQARLNQAYLMLPAERWDTALDLGAGWFVAHYLALGKMAAANAAAPGSVSGPVTSKSVGGVSVSYDTSSSIYSDAGHWNITLYGRQFWDLALLFRGGGIQL